MMEPVEKVANNNFTSVCSTNSDNEPKDAGASSHSVLFLVFIRRKHVVMLWSWQQDKRFLQIYYPILFGWTTEDFLHHISV